MADSDPEQNLAGASATAVDGSSDWEIAAESLRRKPTRWGSLIWVSARPLIAGLNHQISMHAPGLVANLRNHWAPDEPTPVVVDCPEPASSQEFTFMLVGDTGEQDASQYVVAPALSAAVRAHDPAFVMLMSDVIYPAGDIDDYRDGVYRPYLSDEANFSLSLHLNGACDPATCRVPERHVAVPILGLPGNHDWYDGLTGFMYHFTGTAEQPAAAPPDAVFAPDPGQAPGDRRQSGLVSKLFRILWRRSAEPAAETAALRSTRPITGSLEQDSPYYQIRTPELMIVCIDPGIDGTIDRTQGAWLARVSAEPGPKILVSGKPLVVDEELHPLPITDDGVFNDDTPTAWDIVSNPDHNYLATIGGDIHNFQLYDTRADQVPDGVAQLSASGSVEPGTPEVVSSTKVPQLSGSQTTQLNPQLRAVPAQSVERPDPEIKTGPQVHLVAGGGGAFMHATHTLAISATDSRLRARPGRKYFGQPADMFPTRGDSLRLFAGLLVPMVRRLLIYVAVLLAVVAGSLIWAAIPRGWFSYQGPPLVHPTLVRAARAAGTLGLIGAGLLVLTLAISMLPTVRHRPRTGLVARVRTAVIVVAIALLAVSITVWLSPAGAMALGKFAAGVLVLHALADGLVRRSGWWRPADEFARNLSAGLFGIGLAGLAALVAAAQLWLGWSDQPMLAVGCAVLSAGLLLAVGGYGWIRRARRLTREQPDGTFADLRGTLRDSNNQATEQLQRLGAENRRWHQQGFLLAQAAQAGCLLLGIVQLLVLLGVAPSWGRAVGLLALFVIGLVVSVGLLVGSWAGLLLVVTELLARRAPAGDRMPGLAAAPAGGIDGRPVDALPDPARTAWGAAARRAHRLIVPGLVLAAALQLLLLTVAGAWFSADLGSGLAAVRAGVGAVTLAVSVVVALLTIDRLRRRTPVHYPWLAGGLGLLVGGVACLISCQVPATGWIGRTVAAAAAFAFALVVVALVGHLSFLGAYRLIFDPTTWGRPSFTDEQLAELFRVRAEDVFPPQQPDPKVVPRNVWTWARITAPALGEPGGPLQREVSEVFSSDQPPFYKNFLRLTTRRSAGGAELTIYLHRVYGRAPADSIEVVRLPLT